MIKIEIDKMILTSLKLLSVLSSEVRRTNRRTNTFYMIFILTEYKKFEKVLYLNLPQIKQNEKKASMIKYRQNFSAIFLYFCQRRLRDQPPVKNYWFCRSIFLSRQSLVRDQLTIYPNSDKSFSEIYQQLTHKHINSPTHIYKHQHTDIPTQLSIHLSLGVFLWCVKSHSF